MGVAHLSTNKCFLQFLLGAIYTNKNLQNLSCTVLSHMLHYMPLPFPLLNIRHFFKTYDKSTYFPQTLTDYWIKIPGRAGCGGPRLYSQQWAKAGVRVKG